MNVSRFRVARISLAVLLSVWLVQPVAAQVTDEVNEITGVREVASEEIRDIKINQYEGNDAGVRAKCELDSEANEEAWTITLYGFSDAPTSVTSAQQLQYVIDGNQVQPLRVESRTRDMSGSTLEVKTAYFSRPVFSQIANADQVVIRAGAAEFELTRSAKSDLQAILETIQPVDARRTASTDGGR